MQLLESQRSHPPGSGGTPPYHTWTRPGRSRLQPPSGIVKISRSGEELFKVKGGKVSSPLKSMGRFTGILVPLSGGSLRPSPGLHHRRARTVSWGKVSSTSPANGDPPPPAHEGATEAQRKRQESGGLARRSQSNNRVRGDLREGAWRPAPPGKGPRRRQAPWRVCCSNMISKEKNPNHHHRGPPWIHRPREPWGESAARPPSLHGGCAAQT